MSDSNCFRLLLPMISIIPIFGVSDVLANSYGKTLEGNVSCVALGAFAMGAALFKGPKSIRKTRRFIFLLMAEVLRLSWRSSNPRLSSLAGVFTISSVVGIMAQGFIPNETICAEVATLLEATAIFGQISYHLFNSMPNLINIIG